MDENGMTTMRLHRLHLSSRHCPRTFAISWPHSQRVSAVVSVEGTGIMKCFLILRTIIKIVGSIGDGMPAVKGAFNVTKHILPKNDAV